MAGDLAVSVVICTRNRAPSLARTLKSLTELAIPGGIDWEVLVVDNGSDDETPSVVTSFESALPIKSLREARVGLTHARNAGMRAAGGAYICWTDDDVLVCTGWLCAYLDAFAAHPDAAIFGGPIVPVAEPPLTPWFEPRMRHWPIAPLVACRDMGPAELPLLPRPDRLPWGANFAIRRREQIGCPFDTNLSFGEETDVISRLLKSGTSGWWIPGASVTHLIPAERQTRAYLDHYYRRAGAAAAYFWDRDGLDNPVAAGAPAWTRTGDRMLRFAVWMTGLVAAAAWQLGLVGASLRWAARKGHIRGVQSHRSARRASHPGGTWR